MAEAISDYEAAGSAIAALSLVQIVFWQLLQAGTIDKANSVDMLKRAVAINTTNDDTAHAIAAAHLGNLLRSVEAYRAPKTP